MKLKKSNSKVIKNEARQKIEKSDALILIARTPVQRAVSDVCNAKNLERILKMILKPAKKEESTNRKIESKQAKGSAEKQELQKKETAPRIYSNAEAFAELYKNSGSYFGKSLYHYKSSVKVGSKIILSEYAQTLANSAKSSVDELGEREILNEHEVSLIQNKIVLNRIVGTEVNHLSIEEKEKFDYYKITNRIMTKIRYDLTGFGYFLLRREDL